MHKLVSPQINEIISKLAQDETGKRQYYRPVYSLHKWWARRPGALLRSITLLASGLGGDLFTLAPDGSVSSHSLYFQDHDLSDLVIFDPFMGGGTTLVEASRMGAKVIGCDLNPVSYWIVRETLKPIDCEQLNAYFDRLDKTAGSQIRDLYKTTCKYCGLEGDTLYAFWVRYVECPHCGRKAYLFKRTLLNKGVRRNKPISRGNPATVFCPRCFALNDWHGQEQCSCRSCGLRFDPQVGTYNQGRYSCQQCGRNDISLIETLRDGRTMHERLVALEYWCPRCRRRLYKEPDEADLEKLEWIERQVRERWECLVLPREEILEGASSARWRKHNYRYYYQVFNARQILAFNYLIAGIKSIPDPEYRNAFITIFSNALEYNNMMTPYNYPHRKLHHLFNYHAMPLTTTPVENAVWGVGDEGAGTFVNCYKRYVRAKEYCRRPFDKYKDARGVVRTVWAGKETIGAKLVSSFAELATTPKGALLLCGDSAHLPSIPDKSIDLVITDPPYFDSIHYSELSNFFYVWLRRLVDHPYFAPSHVPTEQEAIVNEGMNKGEQEYRHLLAAVFTETARLLKDEGRLIFTFHHTRWEAWWTIVQALVDAGFQVTDYFPVMSEYKVSPHIRNKQSLDMDLVLICQKSSAVAEQLSPEPYEILRRTIRDLDVEKSERGYISLFLYFMGETLKTATANTDLDRSWFIETLSCFDELIEDLETTGSDAGITQSTLFEQLVLPELV